MDETSHWIEFFGGPYDGTMTEVFAAYGPSDEAGIVVYEKRTPLPNGGFSRGAVRGYYRVNGWADEDLKVIRMRWSHEVPADLT